MLMDISTFHCQKLIENENLYIANNKTEVRPSAERSMETGVQTRNLLQPIKSALKKVEKSQYNMAFQISAKDIKEI